VNRIRRRLPAACAVTVTIVVLAAGCSAVGTQTSAGAAAGGTSTAKSLDGSAWVLAALPGHTMDARSPATVSFEQGRAVGGDGCNRFTAPYTGTATTIAVSERVAGTQMACAPDVMQRAQAFIAALTGAKTWRISDGQLQLLNAGGAVLATLAPQSRALAGTSWHANGINNGRNAVVSLVAGTTVTLQFGLDGRVSGSAGCNNYTATYEADGSRIRISGAATTRKMCAGESVMEQEQAFLKALEAATTLRIDGNRLELRDDKGALQVGAARAAGS